MAQASAPGTRLRLVAPSASAAAAPADGAAFGATAAELSPRAEQPLADPPPEDAADADLMGGEGAAEHAAEERTRVSHKR